MNREFTKSTDQERPRKTWLEVVMSDMKEGLRPSKCRCSGPSCLEEDCRGHMLTQVCLEFPLDSSQGKCILFCAGN